MYINFRPFKVQVLTDRYHCISVLSSVVILIAEMLFGEAGEVVEMFKNSFPFSFLFFIPILIILSPVSPTAAAHEFAVYRMQQYDLQGTAFGNNSLFFEFNVGKN